MSLTYATVCSGIEAPSVAWEPLQWTPLWFSEIEPFPCSLLDHLYPTVTNVGDMTLLTSKILSRSTPAPDVICGGTPCQAFSVAGLRQSLSDDRGNLTLVFVELINAIDHVRRADGKQPVIVLWENVPGVFSTKDNAFGCFLAAMVGESEPLQPAGKKWTNAGAVYGPERTAAWRVLDAQYFGLAQRRKRVFVVSSAREGFDAAAILFESNRVRRDSPPSREAGQSIAGTLEARTTGGGFPGTDAACSGYVTPHTFDRQSSGEYGEAPIASTDSARDYKSASDLIAHTLRGDGFDASEDGTGRGTPLVAVIAPTLQHNGKAAGSATQQDAENGALVVCHGTQDPCTDKHIAFAIGRNTGQENVVAYSIQAGALRTNPSSGPDGVGVQEGISYTIEARSEVQAVVIAIQDISARDKHQNGKGWSDDNVAYTIDTQATQATQGIAAFKGGQGSGAGSIGYSEHLSPTLGAADSGSNRTPAIVNGMSVRRLTPRECERLQGFPDDYTVNPNWPGWRKMDSDETPESCIALGLEVKKNKKTGKWRVKDVDGPRYKALGNSMAVPVIRWLGNRIQQFVQVTP